MVRLAFVGESTLLIRCLEAVIEVGHRVDFVLSEEASVQSLAASMGVAVHSSWQEVPLETLEDLDFLFSVGHLKRISAAILQSLKGQALNFHDGPLPEYAGLHVTSWALMAQEERHGICWHVMTEMLDAGAIAAKEDFSVDRGETALSLNVKCFEHGLHVFKDVLLPQITTGRIETSPQPERRAVFYSRHQKPKAGGVLSWDKSLLELEAMFRALSFGNYDNPVASPKLLLRNRCYIVLEMQGSGFRSDSPAGTVMSTDTVLAIACSDGVLEITRLAYLSGVPVSLEEVILEEQLQPGQVLSTLTPEEALAFESALTEASRCEAALVPRLTDASSTPIEEISPAKVPAHFVASDWFHAQAAGSLATLVAAYFALMQENCSLLYLEEHSGESNVALGSLRPKHLVFSPESSYEQLLVNDRSVSSVASDIFYRRRFLRDNPAQVAIIYSERMLRELPGVAIALELDQENCQLRVHRDSQRVTADIVERVTVELQKFIASAAANPATVLSKVSLLDESAIASITRFNTTVRDCDFTKSVHDLFVDSARQRGEAPAVSFNGSQVSFAELDKRSSAVASALQAQGVQSGSHVGICVRRSVEMVVAVLGVLKAAAAYVPLDPDFPVERLRGMLEDARPAVILVDSDTNQLWSQEAAVLLTVAEASAGEGQFSADIDTDSLAYTMFTSGSSGRPKGVSISHRNLINFFTGMDDVLESRTDGTWLAVTSLSFDISVLEILWALIRGFKVVVFDHAQGIEPGRHGKAGSLDFSLSYFASETKDYQAVEGYDLLYDGVEFADRNGFRAVWTPERHFHEFGGLFPNPSVTSAALAARTETLELRAGSVVLPLHHPVRVAEDWALVDQLSKGRVGVSFASGWQEKDFVLRPQSYADRKEEMFAGIETVRNLWRGASVTFEGVENKPVEVSIKPLPVQKEIPVWVTAAGNPETFRRAGKLGVGVLTHLLGQSVAELQQKISIYRTAWKEAGHEGEGIVTVMVHTFVGQDSESVREKVYGPLTSYLKTAVGLIKNAPYAFPTFKKPTEEIARKVEEGVRDFSEEEVAQLTDFAFDRYFESSGLFGTVEQCVDRSLELYAAGANEIACLIDFGVASRQVVDSLPLLNEVRSKTQQLLKQQGFSLAEILEREGITHFQSTPSLMQLVKDSERALRALGGLEVLMLGGEPLKQSLVDELRPALNGRLLNMYGPTETTIWSSVADIRAQEWRVNLGQPIANTGIYIVDHHKRILPPGVLGEVLITGEGLASGYLGKPELTTDRFVYLNLPDGGKVRAYRTGDYGRISADGEFVFAGRRDGQVKVSGYRIELGEVEKVLQAIPGVGDIVVVAVGEGLKAYFTGEELCPFWLREQAKAKLPEYMIPFQFVRLAGFPLTPNGKIDRVGLAARVDVAATTSQSKVSGSMLESVQSIWSAILGGIEIDVDVNLFDLGANSLMVVQAAVQLRELLNREIALVDLFQNPTVRGFVASIEVERREEKDPVASPERASKRRAFLSNRQRKRV